MWDTVRRATVAGLLGSSALASRAPIRISGEFMCCVFSLTGDDAGETADLLVRLRQLGIARGAVKYKMDTEMYSNVYAPATDFDKGDVTDGDGIERGEWCEEVPVSRYAAPPLLSDGKTYVFLRHLEKSPDGRVRPWPPGGDPHALIPRVKALAAIASPHAKTVHIRDLHLLDSKTGAAVSRPAAMQNITSNASISPPSSVALASPSASGGTATDTSSELLGVSLAGFKEIIMLFGGEAALAGKTTNELKRMVLNATRDTLLSLTASLDPSHVSHASAFVSHVYSGIFLHAVEAVVAWEARMTAAGQCGPFFYYFDLFVENQNAQKGGVIPFTSLRDIFAAGVLSAGRTLLVLDECATATTRLWCVFEIVTTLEHKIPFEVIMAPSIGRLLRTQLSRGEMYQRVLALLTGIDFKTASAREPEDEENIRRLIVSGLGYAAANKVVIDAMHDWLVGHCRNVLQEMSEKERGLSALSTSLARLLHDRDIFDEAESLYRKAHDVRQRDLGEDHAKTLSCIDGIANVLHKQGRLEEAEAYHRDVLSVRRRVYGSDDHFDIVAGLESIAAICRQMSNSVAAVQFLREALDARRRTLRETHPDLLLSIRNLAGLLYELKLLDEAEPLCREALFKCRLIHGHTHASTLLCVYAYALLLRKRCKYLEAEALYQDELDNRRIHGRDHPDILNLLECLKSCREEQGDVGSPAS